MPPAPGASDPKEPVRIPEAPAIKSLAARKHTENSGSQPTPGAVAGRESGGNSSISKAKSLHIPTSTAACTASGRAKGSEPSFTMFPPKTRRNHTINGDVMEMG